MKQLRISVLILLLFTLFCGVVYPFFVTGIGMALFPEKAGGSLIVKNGTVKGSSLIGQAFTKPEYFHGRPSAVNYDSTLSGGSNLGPTNRKLIESVKERAASIRKEYGINEDELIPSDLLFASGSGLDPHISVESAKLQAGRVASSRKIEISRVYDLIESYKERQLAFYGRSYVNIVRINMALDDGEVKR